MRKAAESKQPFQRLVLPRALAREMFAYNPYKLTMLDAIPPEEVRPRNLRARDLYKHMHAASAPHAI